MYNGIINVYKEAGFTSHDVVAKLRGIFGQKRIGHTGTLDPAAVGVLPVCLGSGTKLVDMIADRSKTYRARVLLGTVTDTEDTTGTVQQVKNLGDLGLADAAQLTDRLAVIMDSFIGGYYQIPPMYSAIRKDGKRLYELAREGKEVERTPRWVDIYSVTVDSVELPYFTMTVYCGKGTYIRSLCRDIGERLGCGACMDALTRTAVGQFSIDQAMTLGALQAEKEAGNLDRLVIPVEDMFAELPRIEVPEKYGRLIENGNRLPGAVHMEKNSQDGQRFRVYYNNMFYGIFKYDKSENAYNPVKMFMCRE